MRKGKTSWPFARAPTPASSDTTADPLITVYPRDVRPESELVQVAWDVDPLIALAEMLEAREVPLS